MEIEWEGEGLRVLDFDTENIPGFYWYDERCTDFLHTIACAWADDPKDYHVWQMRWSSKLGMHFPRRSYMEFKEIVESAGIVTAHNVARHDIPLLNGHADRYGLPRIKWPRVVDTLTHIKKSSGVPRSQEYLADREDLGEKKMHVGLYTWEGAARGKPDAMQVVADRCLSDVISHIELYRRQHPVSR